MKFYGIYKITNKVNGKMYIGQHITDNIDDGYMGSGILIQKAVKKYGKDAFTKEWLEFSENADDLNYLERSYVDKEWLASPDTYNLAYGGNQGNFHNGMLGKHQSAEAKRKMSLSKIGKKNPMYGIQSPWKGKHPSKEQLEKHCISVIVSTINGEFIGKFVSIKEAALATGCTSGKISEVCNGKRQCTRKLVFKKLNFNEQI